MTTSATGTLGATLEAALGPLARMFGLSRTDRGAAPVAGLDTALAGSKPLVQRAIGLTVAVNLLGLLPAVFSLQVYDRVIYRAGLSTLAALAIGMVIMLCFDLLLRRSRSRLLRETAVQIDARVSNALMNHFLALPLRTIENKPAAFWYAAFKDVEVVRAAASGSIALTLMDVPFALLAIALIGFIAWPLLPVVLVGIGALLVLAWRSSDELRGGKIEEYARARTRDDLLAEVCRARESIKSLSHDDSVRGHWRDAYGRWVQESFQKNGEIEDHHELSTTMSLTISMLITVMGALAVINQWMTVGGLIATNMLASKSIGPLVALCNQWRAIAHAREAGARLDALFNEAAEKPHSGLVLPRPTGRITLDGMTFQYPGTIAPVHDDVHATIGPTGLCAVVGDNGGGKSTLLKLIRGLYVPAKGRVLLDDYDIAQFSRHELADWVGYLPQFTYLFDGTVLDNLRRSAPQASDEQIVLACQRSGAHPFITQMPDGYASQVGEGGMRLSAGQKRRIGIAQAMLRDPQVLLLDEPTNDLDFAAESHLIQTMKELARTRTLVVITHSIRLMAACDSMLHVGKGGRIEVGATAAMLQKHYGIHMPAGPARAASVPSHATGTGLREGATPVTTAHKPVLAAVAP